MTTNRSKQDIDNANTLERIKGAALLTFGVLLFNPPMAREGWVGVTEPEANNFGSHG